MEEVPRLESLVHKEDRQVGGDLADLGHGHARERLPAVLDAESVEVAPAELLDAPDELEDPERVADRQCEQVLASRPSRR